MVGFCPILHWQRLAWIDLVKMAAVVARMWRLVCAPYRVASPVSDQRNWIHYSEFKAAVLVHTSSEDGRTYQDGPITESVRAINAQSGASRAPKV
jgi:hypothetical protein